jgi:thioredoxin-related protein
MPLYREGETIAVPGVSFTSRDRTLLLVTQKGCRYCDQSMPFYQALGADDALGKRTQIVLLAPDEEAVSREELAQRGVRVDKVIRMSLSQLKVRGTPTAIVVNRQGVIERVLPGLLDEARQAQLMDALKTAGSSN